VSGADTGFALGTQGIGSAVVLNGLFWCSLVAFLATHGFRAPGVDGHGSTSASILLVVAAAVGVILLGAFGGLFYLLTRGQERARRIIHAVAAHIRFLDADRFTSLVERLARRFAVLMDDKPLLARAVGWATANWLLDAASLWVFVAAFAHVISPVDLLTAYGLANILAAIPITPGGLGVVEFVLVSMLAGSGLTDGQALSAVLAYRAVNFWLPIPFGGLAYASIELEHRSVRIRLKRRVLLAQARTVEILATAFARTGRTDDATSAGSTAPAPPAPGKPTVATVAGGAGGASGAGAPTPPVPGDRGPAVPTRVPSTPPPSAGSARPAPHPGAAVVLRAQGVGTDPAG
jgi:uncharacterized membrane protein YbhN (UPF0104 family)